MASIFSPSYRSKILTSLIISLSIDDIHLVISPDETVLSMIKEKSLLTSCKLSNFKSFLTDVTFLGNGTFSIFTSNPTTFTERLNFLRIRGCISPNVAIIVLPSEKEAKSLCEARVEESKDVKIPLNYVTQDSAFQNSVSEELNIIIKSDVHGSSEAIKNAIDQIKHEEVKPKILLSDIGMVTETDVTLAKASKAVPVSYTHLTLPTKA